MTGVVFSNIMLAALPEALDNKIIYISPNAAPSSIAGKHCNPLFFAVSWPNDAYHEAAGQFANERGLQERLPDRAELPGRQGLARRLQAHLQGQDRRRELHQARPARLRGRARRRCAPPSPQALYIFLPGGMGINFIKQFVGAGPVGKDIDAARCRASRPTRT